MDKISRIEIAKETTSDGAVWWVAHAPEINVGTQAKTFAELAVELERIVEAHFETAAALGVDPYRVRH